MVERRPVEANVGGSSPLDHPSCYNIFMATKLKRKTSIFIIALFIVLGFYGYKAIKLYKSFKQNNPEYCVKKDTGSIMSHVEALQIAKQSPCKKEGIIFPFSHNCNEYSGTWWINMIVSNHKGCFPACVVDIETKNAKINWRCTGLIPPK